MGELALYCSRKIVIVKISGTVLLPAKNETNQLEYIHAAYRFDRPPRWLKLLFRRCIITRRRVRFHKIRKCFLLM